MSMVSAKNLSCWGFDDAGSWFRVCLSDKSTSSYHNHVLSPVALCWSWIDPLHVGHVIFSATTVYGVGAPEFPLFGHFCWCILGEDCWPASDWIVVLPGVGLHDPLELMGDTADSCLCRGCLVWPSSWLPWWSVCTILPCRLIRCISEKRWCAQNSIL